MPGVREPAIRQGVDEFLSAAGYRYFITDAHLARAGTPLDPYGGGSELDAAIDAYRDRDRRFGGIEAQTA